MGLRSSATFRKKNGVVTTHQVNEIEDISKHVSLSSVGVQSPLVPNDRTGSQQLQSEITKGCLGSTGIISGESKKIIGVVPREKTTPEGLARNQAMKMQPSHDSTQKA